MCEFVSFCIRFCNAKKPATLAKTLISNVVTGRQCQFLSFPKECNGRFFACKRLFIL